MVNPTPAATQQPLSLHSFLLFRQQKIQATRNRKADLQSKRQIVYNTPSMYENVVCRIPTFDTFTFLRRSHEE